MANSGCGLSRRIFLLPETCDPHPADLVTSLEFKNRGGQIGLALVAFRRRLAVSEGCLISDSGALRVAPKRWIEIGIYCVYPIYRYWYKQYYWDSTDG